ncbi:MAG: ATPase, T2SS/T4P/T4SS family, partial [Mariprofundaceae bacterium]|nr:ATPase, T2SS/T4P/T4SS family [Mariprofundaceae bacterium]
TLHALATLLRPNLKVVTIEDTPELRLPLKNWVQLVSRPSYGIGAEKIGEITLYDLVKVSLRYRPDIIIVGEVHVSALPEAWMLDFKQRIESVGLSVQLSI